ncbi:hypothetical protein FJV80_13130 [Mesorhizobium sp. WSM4310]|uniref:hypothetical protein n=1 Tax=Mesorhizobium sp. WSM4310 TaxID=2589883 RepID=UPI00115E5EB7|nr:hypothetical protein [Mesorhizobium sp. WSM4310]TRC87669.1 hypothetical protein FJV80_13130 [Mesorhizobium sp. WSM4310]
MLDAMQGVRGVVTDDLDPDFLYTLCVELGWGYARLFDALQNSSTHDERFLEEEFNRRRGAYAMQALAQAAHQHGVPFEWRRLDCNGQRKILVRAGRVILIQEPIVTITDHPQTADYKVALSDLNSYVRQLELDLGDQPGRILDWSGCVLAVVLHGAAGPRFSREHKCLGGLMLGVPDAAYRQWTMRLDLHQIAMFGRAPVEKIGTPEPHPQRDRVIILPKKKNSSRDTA